MRTCSECRRSLPATQEYFYTRGDGLFRRCKECVSQRQRAYRKANAERISEREAAYRSKMLEHRAAVKAAWKVRNREQIASRQRLADAAAAENYRSGRVGAAVPSGAGYAKVHRLLSKSFGRARNHPCEGVDCTRMAAEWALVDKRGALMEMVRDSRVGRERKVPFSRDLSKYRPLCTSCHFRMDAHGAVVLQGVAASPTGRPPLHPPNEGIGP